MKKIKIEDGTTIGQAIFRAIHVSEESGDDVSFTYEGITLVLQHFKLDHYDFAYAELMKVYWKQRWINLQLKYWK